MKKLIPILLALTLVVGLVFSTSARSGCGGEGGDPPEAPGTPCGQNPNAAQQKQCDDQCFGNLSCKSGCCRVSGTAGDCNGVCKQSNADSCGCDQNGGQNGGPPITQGSEDQVDQGTETPDQSFTIDIALPVDSTAQLDGAGFCTRIEVYDFGSQGYTTDDGHPSCNSRKNGGQADEDWATWAEDLKPMLTVEDDLVFLHLSVAEGEAPTDWTTVTDLVCDWKDGNYVYRGTVNFTNATVYN